MWRGSLASPVLPVMPSISHCPLGRPVGLRGAGARWEEFFWEAPVRSHCSPLATRKISRDDVAELCVSLLDCPGGADVSFEIKSTVPFSQPWTEEDSQGGKARDWADELRKADLQAGVTGKTNRRTGWSPTGWYFRSFVFQSNVYHTRQERGRGYITRVTQSLAPATFAALAVHALKFETSKSSCPREEDPAATTMRGTITKGQICPTWYGSTTPPT